MIPYYSLLNSQAVPLGKEFLTFSRVVVLLSSELRSPRGAVRFTLSWNERRSFESSGTLYAKTRLSIPEDLKLYQHNCDAFKSYSS